MGLEFESPRKLHFVLTPYMAQGHLIPMIDIAKLLAQHGVVVTIITTPVNANRVRPTLARAMESHGDVQIRMEEVEFPSEKTGLPKLCESLDQLPSLDLTVHFLDKADELLGRAVDKLFDELEPRPDCIISDMSFPYTSFLAQKHGIPRISFVGFSCFASLCTRNINREFLNGLVSDSEPFVVPGLPDRIELTKNQLPSAATINGFGQVGQRIGAAEALSYGTIFNSFQELEPGYVSACKEALGGKAWCVGPVSLCNKDRFDQFQRGNRSAMDAYECLEWLNTRQPCSVVYVCLGSICNIPSQQLIELGLGLEASNHPFIWVVRGGETSKDLLNWVKESGFEERTKYRGFLIQGWAPQIVILSHPAIGGFLTHCGWNSTLEAICAGIPLVTWPLFGDQFCNERLIVDVLKIGVKSGVDTTMKWGQEEKIGVMVKKEDVTKAIQELMGEGEEMEKRRNRVEKLSEMSKLAPEDGGSSYINIELLIKDIFHHREASILK